MNKRMITGVILSAYVAITAVIYASRIGRENAKLVNNLFYIFAPLAAVVGTVYAAKRFAPGDAQRRLIMCIAWGFMLWLMGEIIFIYFELFGLDPFPSIADVFYIAGYPLFFAGLIQALWILKFDWRTLRAESKFMAALIIMGGLFIIAYFGIFLTYNIEATLLENMVAMFYGLGDFIILVPCLLLGMAVVEIAGGKFFIPWASMFLSMLFIMIADILYGIFSEGYEAGGFWYIQMDLLWVVGYAIASYGFFALGFSLDDVQNRVAAANRKTA